jgi:hypothetical protein
MADVRAIIEANIRAGRQERVDPRAAASKAAPLGLIELTEAPRAIERADRSTFAPNLDPNAVREGLRSRRTYDGTSHGETNSVTSPLGVPQTGGRPL